MSRGSREEGELTLAERETFLSIFFFKGFAHPERELEDFVNHYEARGWVPNNSTRPVVTPNGRAALARNWTPKSGDGRFPKCLNCLAWLREGYHKAAVKFGVAKAGAILRDIADVRVAGGNGKEFAVRTTREVFEMLRSVDNPYVPGLVEKVTWSKSYKQEEMEKRE